MHSTRRGFLRRSGIVGAALGTAGQALRSTQSPTLAGEMVLSTSGLTKWVDPLPIPSRARPIADGNGAHYCVAMREFQSKVHRDLPPTTFWGYGGSSPGPTFEARSGEPIVVEWQNRLPAKHFLPIDHTLHGAEADKPQVRTVVHLHGGRVGSESDGYPEHWFTPGQSAVCHYPNRQDAATLFYHDHAMGITRLNAVAGLFGIYLIRDEHEESLGLPRGQNEIPLVICDRLFKANGQLHYPTSGDPRAPWTSEFYGNSILVNGKLFPFLDVEPHRYRFRLVNPSNAGFYQLSLSRDDVPLIPGEEKFYQIGTDQGLLAAPVALKMLTITPGERADLIIDFNAYRGKQLYLKHGSEPILQFRIGKDAVADDSRMPVSLGTVKRFAEAAAAKTRELTLDDYKDNRGNAHLMLLNGMHWSMPVTENPLLDSTEVWTLVNLTDDTHPIHLHLVRFQILDRRRFDFGIYKQTKKLVFTGPPAPPEPNEMGWKDTVRADVLMATRIIVKFEGFAGRYVWHCHVLEHEDNEMMRPYTVLGT